MTFIGPSAHASTCLVSTCQAPSQVAHPTPHTPLSPRYPYSTPISSSSLCYFKTHSTPLCAPLALIKYCNQLFRTMGLQNRSYLSCITVTHLLALPVFNYLDANSQVALYKEHTIIKSLLPSQAKVNHEKWFLCVKNFAVEVKCGFRDGSGG